MDLGLTGKLALVTGGTRGIGFACANALRQEGVKTIICSRSREHIAVATLALGLGDDSRGILVDVLDRVDIKQLMATIDAEIGGVDILINNVGGGGRWGSEIFEETPLSTGTEVYLKNVGVAAELTKWAIPHMRKQKWGRVVTITSILGGKEGNGRPWFVMAKAAQTALMKSLATQSYLARDGITFNSVAPGLIDVGKPGLGNEELPLGRMGTPEEVANVVAFLCSPLASLVNGCNLVVDGGQSRAI